MQISKCGAPLIFTVIVIGIRREGAIIGEMGAFFPILRGEMCISLLIRPSGEISSAESGVSEYGVGHE